MRLKKCGQDFSYHQNDHILLELLSNGCYFILETAYKSFWKKIKIIYYHKICKFFFILFFGSHLPANLPIMDVYVRDVG